MGSWNFIQDTKMNELNSDGQTDTNGVLSSDKSSLERLFTHSEQKTTEIFIPLSINCVYLAGGFNDNKTFVEQPDSIQVYLVCIFCHSNCTK